MVPIKYASEETVSSGDPVAKVIKIIFQILYIIILYIYI